MLDQMESLMTDKQRRAIYDVTRTMTYHDTSKQPGKTHHTPGMHDVIKQFVPRETLSKFPDVWPRQAKSKDVTHALKCTLEEFYNGKVIKLKIARSMPCEICKGIGYASTLSNPPQLAPCVSCMAKGVERKPNVLSFSLVPGVRNGYRKRLRGQGDNIPKQIPSDIYLVVDQKNHDQFIRRGSDLILLLKVSLLEHLTGTTKFIRHLEAHSSGNGFKMLKMKIPPLKTKLVVRNKGMPKTSIENGELVCKRETFGNLIIDIVVDYPDSLTSTVQSELSAIIPEHDIQGRVEPPADVTLSMDTFEVTRLCQVGENKWHDQNMTRDKVDNGEKACPVQ